MGLRALVVTPTTGSPDLIDAIRSVKNQTYQDVDHLLVVDGANFTERTNKTLSTEKIIVDEKLLRIDLPFNTGGQGFYGHRIMAAFSHLIDHDVVLFLDQDNWYDPTHVETIVNELKMFNLDWAYSLRKVYDKEKVYVCDDNCESLGRWPAWINDETFLVDSSSYCFKTSFLRKVGYMWDWGWGADRRFYTMLKDKLKHQNYTCTGKHTLCYRLGGNDKSVTGEFFLEGNKKIIEKYNGKMPWVGGR